MSPVVVVISSHSIDVIGVICWGWIGRKGGVVGTGAVGAWCGDVVAGARISWFGVGLCLIGGGMVGVFVCRA